MTVQTINSINGGHHTKLLLLRIRQGIISLGPILITISLGLAEGYSAILIPQLENDSTWSIDTELSSWIASIATLPMSIGCLLGGWLMEAIGRKMLHLATCIPNFIGWILIAFCDHSISLLLIGRFITGMCVGVLSPVLMIYVAETSDPIFRSFLLPSISLALNLGIAMAHIMGTYLQWQLVALLACLPAVLCFIVMLFVPESPTYLIKKNRIDEAKRHFIWFRGSTASSQQEFEALVARQAYEATLPPNKNYLETFKKPEFYKPLLILILFFSVMQLSGTNPIAFYTVNILQQVLTSSFNPYTSMMIMDGVRIIASILGCFAQQYMKRRKLMVFSCSGTLISLLILSLYLFLNEKYYFGHTWIALAALISYVLFINIGLLPLPYSMSGELFAQASRGLGSGIVALMNMILMFVLVKLTPFMFEGMTTPGVFLFFGLCCLIGMILLIVLLPETKDKPLHEIEDYFRGKRNEEQYIL